MAKKVPNPIDVHVGSRVRIRRLELGMSQGKLGDALGITFQQVQKYEKGTNRISSSRLQHVSRILHVAITYFFEGSPGQLKAKGNAPSSAYVSDFVAATDGLALAKAFTQIKNANVRHHIVKLVNEIAGGEGPYDSEEPSMQTVATIGLDIAKSAVQVHGIAAEDIEYD